MRLFSFLEIVENVVWLASGNFQKGKLECLVEWKSPFIPLVIDRNEHLFISFTNLYFPYAFFDFNECASLFGERAL